MNSRPQPPPEIKTTDIAEVFRLVTRAVYAVQCVSPRLAETLQHKLEWVHARHCPLDLQALQSSRADLFKHDIMAIMTYGSMARYEGPALHFALQPQMLECYTVLEPANYLRKGDDHPYIQHGQQRTWSMRAAEGCIQALLHTPELVHAIQGIDDLDQRANLMGLMNDIIIEAARQGGVNFN